MPTLLPPSCFRFGIAGTYAGGDWSNVFHALANVIGSPTDDELATVGDTVLDNFATTIGSLMCHTALISECRLEYMDDDVLRSAFSAAADNGGDSGSGTVNSLSAVISWKTHEAWRGGHPRTYVAAMPEAALLDTQHVTDTYRSSCVDAGTAYWESFLGISTDAIDGLTLGCVRTTPDLHFAGFLSVPTVSNRIRTQRRRLNPI